MKKHRLDFTITAVFLAAVIASLVVFYAGIKKQYIEISNSAERAMYIAFEKIDDLLRETENIIGNNRGVMSGDFDNIAKSDLVELVRDIESVKLTASYVEELVIYKNNSDLFITSNGTVDRNSFYKYSYSLNEDMLRRFDEAAESFYLPSVVALSDEDGGVGDVFVVPKKIDMYDAMMLIFINEKYMMDFCGLSKDNKLWQAALLDAECEPVISGSDNPDFGKDCDKKLANRSRYYRGGLFSPFEDTKWFNYFNMVYHIEINNRVSLTYFFGLILMIICAAGFLLYYRRLCGALTRRVKENGTALKFGQAFSLALTEQGFAAEHKEALEAMLGEENSGYILFCICFTDIQKKKLKPGIEQISEAFDAPCGVRLARAGANRINGIACFKKHDKAGEDMLSAAFGRVLALARPMGEAVIIRSEFFRDIADAAHIYDELKYLSHNYSISKTNCVITGADLELNIGCSMPENIKPVMIKLLDSGDVTELAEYVSALVDEYTANGITLESYIVLINTIYLSFINSVETSGIAENELSELKGLFFKSVKSAGEDLTVHALKTTLINLIVMILSKRKAKKRDNTDTKLMKYIHSHYKEEIYLDKVAQEFGFTGKYLSAYFKRHFNIGFNEYVTGLRIEEAKNLLRTTDAGITEISAAVGYVNNATFNVAFKKITGQSPSAYREQNRKSEQ